jgi:hypothetical protein
MINFSSFSIKNSNNLASDSKAFMTMFMIYYENMWYDLEWASDDNVK